MNDFPAPLTLADCDFRNMQWMRLAVVRVLDLFEHFSGEGGGLPLQNRLSNDRFEAGFMTASRGATVHSHEYRCVHARQPVPHCP
jgi:hypothetical protein